MDARWEKHADESVARAVEKVITETELPGPLGELPSRKDLKALKDAGSELWLDTGDRDEASRNWTAELSGLTTNNTLINKVIQKGIYDDVIHRSIDLLHQSGLSLDEEDMVVEVGFIVNSHIARSLVSTFGAKVSVELHPAISRDADATVMFARRYFKLDPDNFYIKVPLTPAGAIAVRRLSDEGIKVNFTLGFSARQNHLLARVSRPTFVNVFLGRDNQVVVENNLGDGKNVGEKATLASQREVLEARKEGVTDTLQIAASLRSADQVGALAGVDVHTIPPAVIEKFCEMNVEPSEINSQVETDPEVEVGDDAVNVLWEVPDSFKSMTEALGKEDVAGMTPEALVEFAHSHGVNDLFGDYSEGDLKTIRDKGKIPDLSQWKGRPLALDDLLTTSALEAFAKDQQALDERIAGFIKKA